MKNLNFITKKVTSLLVLGVMVLFFQNCAKIESASLSATDSIVLPSFFACNQSSSRIPNQSELKRLNKFELRNTLNDLFGVYLNASDLNTFMTSIEPYISAIPNEASDEGLDYFDQSLSSTHLDRMITVAEMAASQIVNVESYRDSVLGACSNNMSDVSCMSSFLSRFGRFALRGQMSSDDVSWYQDVFTGHVDGYENLIAALLSSPKFLYHFELGVDSSDISNLELTNFEKASRLSYFLLQSMPDDALLSAAESGGVLTQEEINSNITRIISLPLAKKRLTESLANQIFKISHTPDIRTDIESLNTMVSQISSLTSLEDLKSNMIQEVYDYLHYVIWEIDGGYEELMTVDLVFPRTDDLAEVYGTSVWNGDYSEANLVRSPAGERLGILTRAQQLVSGSGATGLIHRGVRVFNDFLCGELPAPAETEPPAEAIVLDTHSGREVIQAITEVEGTSCVGCHKGIINPLGIPFETFDPLGRFRLDEDIYHPESVSERGTVLTVKRVDTTTQIQLGDEVLNANLSDSVDLVRSLASSEKALACFNKHLWSFAVKQGYDLGRNDCATGSLYKEMIVSGSIRHTLESIPLQPEFFRRKLQ